MPWYFCAIEVIWDAHTLVSLSAGSSSTYRLDDANEDTIGVLVRLITEKKGQWRGRQGSFQPGGGLEGLSNPVREPEGPGSHSYAQGRGGKFSERRPVTLQLPEPPACSSSTISSSFVRMVFNLCASHRCCSLLQAWSGVKCIKRHKCSPIIQHIYLERTKCINKQQVSYPAKRLLCPKGVDQTAFSLSRSAGLKACLASLSLLLPLYELDLANPV